jgi:hypothetical protein
MAIVSCFVFHWADGTITSHEWCGADPDTLEVYWEPPLPDKELVKSYNEWDNDVAENAAAEG